MIEELIEKHEGRYSFMYLDSKGLVTVGVGHYLPTPEDACTLFGYDVTADYSKVKAMPADERAEAYQYPGCPMLTDAEVDSQFEVDCQVAKNWAEKLVSYDSLPEEAQAVVVDMIFTLGEDGFSEFHHTIDAFNAQNWGVVASNMMASKWYEEDPNRVNDDIALLQSIAN